MGWIVERRYAVLGRYGNQTLSTDFDKYKPAVASIIPPQKAGRVAELAGVADRTGWCPVDPVTFESKLQKTSTSSATPRSRRDAALGSAAHSQAQICAAAIAHACRQNAAAPTLTSSCYSLIAPDYAISQKGTYRPATTNTPRPRRPGHQPAGRAAQHAQGRGRAGRRLVPHHHRRGVRMTAARHCRSHLALAAPAWRKRRCVPTRWSATPFRNR
jgi:hypothetical protein